MYIHIFALNFIFYIMKNVLLLSAILFLGFSSFKQQHESNLAINNDLSTVEWIGKKVAGQHNGSIKIKEGSFHIHEGSINSGKIIMDMESITCNDLEGKWGDKLVGHLNSADFFDVDNHKTSSLYIKEVISIKENQYLVKGELTIKGISNPIEFPSTIEIKDNKLAAFSEIKIDRTLYDIKYGSGKFFEGLGDKMIDDEFVIKFKIAAE